MARKFQLKSAFSPKGDQPKAIKKLLDGINSGVKYQTLIGVTGSGKTFTLANVIEKSQKPSLIMAPNKTLAAQLYSEMKEFFPENAVEYFVSYYDYYQPEAYVPASDTYIEKDASINEQIEQMRLSATKALLERKDVIIIASVSAIYGLGDPDSYMKMLLHLTVGEVTKQREILTKLSKMQYTRNDVTLIRGHFRVKGEVIDIFPADSEERAIRVEMFDDEVENLSWFDPLTGEKLKSLHRVTVYPKTHYVTPKSTILNIIDDINIIPHQGVSSKWEVNKISEINSDYYLSDESYPAQNLVISDRLSGRGIEMISIQVTPYTYHPSSKKLEVLSQVNIHIIEDGENPEGYLTQPVKSRIFEQLYKSLIINFESSTRDEDYQQPAILYICGGNSETNSDFKNLLDWRRQRGYVVYTASISETGSSSSSIKNYIQNAYHTFSPPPEYVALLGDVDGSYSVATYYDGHGHNSYGNECEGDHPYSQLDGTDLIPEVLIGRMSIRTSSELSVVSSKIINYEKATYLGYLDDYFERAAMAGDPSTSGISCTITKEYVAELLDALL